MSTYGIRITEAGYEVTNPNIDPRRIVFTSEYEAPKIAEIYSGSFSWDTPSPPNGEKTITIAHGLGLVPQAIAMARHGVSISKTESWRVPYSITIKNGSLPSEWAAMTCEMSIDDTNVVLQFDISDSTQSGYNYYSVIVWNNEILES